MKVIKGLTVISLVVFMVAFLTFFPTQKSFADVRADFKEMGIEVNLVGDRWKLDEAGGGGSKYQQAKISDKKKDAYITLSAQRSNKLPQYLIDSAARAYARRFLKKYGKDYVCEINDKKQSQTILESGHEVTIIRYDTTINSNRREVRLVYFTNNDNDVTYLFLIYNIGRYVELDQITKVVLDGVTFTN